MFQRTLGCVALFGWLMAASVSLQAHHSLAGVYDMKKETNLEGTVASIKFSNPHGSLTLTVKNADGTTTDWVMTLGSATALAQRGIGKTGPNALHAGDNIKVMFLPAQGRQSVRLSQDRDHAGRARDPDRRSERHRIANRRRSGLSWHLDEGSLGRGLLSEPFSPSAHWRRLVCGRRGSAITP